jgi:hypothetical protein
MAEWSNDASEYLGSYLKQVEVLVRGQGGDPSDVVDGLRDHVLNELEGVASVSMDELLPVLNNLGSPEEVVNLDPIPKGRPVVDRLASPPPPPPAPVPSKKSKTVVVHRSPASCAVAGCLIAVGGVVGLAVLSILASILLPAFARSREAARRAECQMNLKELHAGLTQFAEANDQAFPPVDVGYEGIMFNIDVLHPDIVKDFDTFICPSSFHEDSKPTRSETENLFDYDYVYFTHVVTSEREVIAYLDAVANAKETNTPLSDPIVLEDGAVLERIELMGDHGGVEGHRIPLIVERTDHHVPTGYNVLFLDSHVQYGRIEVGDGFLWNVDVYEAIEKHVGAPPVPSNAVMNFEAPVGDGRRDGP